MIRVFFTRQFASFVAVGGVAALLHWLSRIALSIWLPFGWAVAVAYIIGITIAFVLNSVFVFPRSTRPRAAQARDFVLINLAFFPVVWAIAVGVNRGLVALGMTKHSMELAHAIAIPVPMLATFLLYKFLAFKDGAHE